MGVLNNEERKQIRRLKGRAHRYHQMLGALPDGVVLQSGGVIRYANDAAAHLFGVEAAQLVGRRYVDLVLASSPATQPFVEQQTLRGSDGRLIEVEATTRTFTHGKRRYLQTILRESGVKPVQKDTPAERLRMMAESRTAIVVLDAIGDVVRWSQAAEQMTGYTSAEMIGRSLGLLVPEDEDESVDLDEILRKTVSAGRIQIEGWKRRKDGSRFYAMQIFTVLLDAAGGVAGFSLAIRDLTDTESGGLLRDTEEQLRQAQRMEAVGRLASGIAHDFNNLLTAIQGHAQFLTEDLDPAHPSRADVDEILHSSERAAALTRQLLAFSRGQRLQPESIQLNSVVSAMERLLRRVISEDINVECNLDPQLWSVRADPSQVEQILVNLIVNARDAMPRGGRITIKTANAELATSYAQRREEVEPGQYVMLAIADTGTGMDAETQAHIFEPFFTTKAPDKGTGLGLSTVFGIIRQMNGHIYVYSEPGKGTTFKVYLPRAGAPPPARMIDSQQRDRARAREGVLIVEDDDSVRALARRVLESRDYRVWLAASAEEAMHILRDYGEQLSLLITDVVLPKLGGRDLAEAALRQWPHLGVIYMSGYTKEELRRHGVISADDHFMEKPFTPDAFARRVRTAIDDLSVNLLRSRH